MGTASQGREEGTEGTHVQDRTLTRLGADVRGGEGVVLGLRFIMWGCSGSSAVSWRRTERQQCRDFGWGRGVCTGITDGNSGRIEN